MQVITAELAFLTTKGIYVNADMSFVWSFIGTEPGVAVNPVQAILWGERRSAGFKRRYTVDQVTGYPADLVLYILITRLIVVEPYTIVIRS